MSQTIEKKRIIFICTHNSARSQMAEGLLRATYGDRFEVLSAGTQPTAVNPHAVRAMAEIGIDISQHRVKAIGEFQGLSFDLVVTVCQKAHAVCPFISGGKRYLHQEFDDPSAFMGTEDEIMSGFRRVRDEIGNWIKITFANIDL